MTAELAGRKAYSWDFDDTIIGRGAATRALGVAKAKLKPTHLPKLTLPDIPSIVREIVDEPIEDIFERISFETHARRRVLPGVKNILEGANTEGTDNFGNTGRANKRIWVEMTQATLEAGKVIDLFEDILYTPHDTPTAISKAAGTQELRRHYAAVSHLDDDPRTAAYIATLFPDVTVYLLQYGSTGMLYSRQEIDRLPNIRRVGILQEINRQ